MDSIRSEKNHNKKRGRRDAFACKKIIILLNEKGASKLKLRPKNSLLQTLFFTEEEQKTKY